jgi:predicted RNase H-like HicB family nuclease
MSIAELPRQGDMVPRDRITEWTRFEGNAVYECRVLLCPEAQCGGYSIHALDLHGVVSQGETVNEAIDRIIDAYIGAIASYTDSANPIPWGPVTVEEAPKESRELRIRVNA